MIKATRDSVCMGDDCNAPNTKFLEYNPEQLLSEWILVAVTRYVPAIYNTVWAIHNENVCIGYLICDKEGKYSVDVPDNNLPMNTLHIKEIHCQHFYEMDFHDKYPDCATLLDKVKRYIEGK